MSDQTITGEDLHAGATVVSGAVLPDFLQSDDLKDFLLTITGIPGDAATLAAVGYGIAIGVAAERHRVHRLEH